jgi:hypothetical protein
MELLPVVAAGYFVEVAVCVVQGLKNIRRVLACLLHHLKLSEFLVIKTKCGIFEQERYPVQKCRIVTSEFSTCARA